MNYYKIKKNCIANGEGIRTALFVSGCSLNCEGCFNFFIQAYNSGGEFTDEVFEEICNSMHSGIQGISLLGGDPTASRNIETVIELCRKFKERFPDKTIWCWSGFKLDLSEWGTETEKNIYHSYKDGSNPTLYSPRLMKYIDVLVDGRWEQDLYNPNLLWAGSENQRVIDVKKTMDCGKVVLYSDNWKDGFAPVLDTLEKI